MVDEVIPNPETEGCEEEKDSTTPAARRRSGESIFLGLPCQEDPIFDLDESREIPSHAIDNLWSPVAVRSTTENEPTPLGWYDDEEELSASDETAESENDEGSSAADVPGERRTNVEDA